MTLERRTPMKRTEMKRTRGRKGKENAAALDAVTPDLIRRSRGRCEARVARGCKGRGEARHHRRRVRSDNRLTNLLWLCVPCHSYIHANPQWARDHGLLLRRSQDPDECPVIARGRRLAGGR